jgi:transcriptional regulator with XRE-family HTH domain
MLNAPIIKAAMAERGLSQAALAGEIGVSKEAVSNWLAGESVPRPRKLKALADFLGLALDRLVDLRGEAEPQIAYRTRERKPATGDALRAGLEVGRHLEQLLPYAGAAGLMSPRVFHKPALDDRFIKDAASATRGRMGLGPLDVLPLEGLIEEFHGAGALLVPVLWGGEREGHENAMSVFLPESQATWVLINLGCKQEDFKYWLSHELGHCMTMHALREDDGETFCEQFAKHLVFPEELADKCLQEMLAGADRLKAAREYANRYGVSEVSVVRSAQRAAQRANVEFEKIDTDEYFDRWRPVRQQSPSVARQYFGTDTPDIGEYIRIAEGAFRTPVFAALERFQREEGGRNPAFIARTLNIGLLEATEISKLLWGRSR